VPKRPASIIRRHRNARASAFIGVVSAPEAPRGAMPGVTTSFRPPRCFRTASGTRTVSICAAPVGNQDFTWFGTTRSKSRLNFLTVLSAGHGDYAVNDEALAYMRNRGLASPLMARLLARLHERKSELLRVLDRQEIPLHTNGSENDIRACVTKRKITGGTQSEAGRDCRDAFLGLAKTRAKLGVSFWNYQGHRLRAPGAAVVPALPDLVRLRATV
jgi:hypothetical protein